MRPIEDTEAPKVFAESVLREVPLGQLQRFLGRVGRVQGEDAMGSGCGNGCGGGCGNSCALSIDRFGHSGLTPEQIAEVIKDSDQVRALVRDRAGEVLGRL
ncbi:MAG TPA: hypothetical protein VE596_12505 [Gaiellaceae bacterium]|nr:hypothetical protein [Gaiellaceae bacterium]